MIDSHMGKNSRNFKLVSKNDCLIVPAYLSPSFHITNKNLSVFLFGTKVKNSTKLFDVILIDY